MYPMAKRKAHTTGDRLQPRTVALLTLLGLATLSIVKGFLHIDDASTVIIATISGAVLGYYFGVERGP